MKCCERRRRIKLPGIGITAVFTFLIIAAIAEGYVAHYQEEGPGPELSEGQAFDNLGVLDIVRCGMSGFETDIIHGHGCVGEKGNAGCPGQYSFVQSHTSINFYSSFKVTDRGYVLRDGDTYCRDDELKTEYDANAGEWFTKGGPQDTPPVKWMSCDELKSTLRSLVEWHKTNTYPDSYLPAEGSHPESYMVDNSALERKDVSAYLAHSPYFIEWDHYYSVLCCQDEISPELKTEDNGNHVYEVNVNPVCFKYFDSINTGMEYVPEFKPLIFSTEDHYSECVMGELYEYFDDTGWIDDYFRSDLFRSNYTLTLRPVEGGRGPDIELKAAAYESAVNENAPIYIKAEVKNTGDMKAHIDSISMNLPDYNVLDGPISLEPGEESEIIIESVAKGMSELKLTIDFFSDETGCLLTKDFSETFMLGIIEPVPPKLCKNNEECAVEGIGYPACCKGRCYDMNAGVCDDIDGDGTFEWTYY